MSNTVSILSLIPQQILKEEAIGEIFEMVKWGMLSETAVKKMIICCFQEVH